MAGGADGGGGGGWSWSGVGDASRSGSASMTSAVSDSSAGLRSLSRTFLSSCRKLCLLFARAMVVSCV